jgi:PIN domain nuclease of toxin-antitoxin system
VRLLLDTHALLWALGAPSRLSPRAAEAVRSADNEVFVSAANIWEIAIKAALGKLDADVDEVVREVREVGFSSLSITLPHARRVRSLEPHHRDPFDRLLVAQALEEGLVIVTHDAAFDAYAVPLLWK